MEPRRKISLQGRRLAVRARRRLLGAGGLGTFNPVHLPEPEQRAVYRILNFALRAGNVMLSSGAGTLEVESTMLDLTAACGLRRCEVDVTFTSLTASYIRGDDVEPITALQVVRHRHVDYSRLAGVHALREDLLQGRITPEEAFDRLEPIVAASDRRSPLVVLSWAGMAAAFTVLLGGGALVAAVSFASTALVYLLYRPLDRRGIPAFFLAAFGAAVATAVAMAMVAAHVQAMPSVIVAGGIMVLVPGYALVASVQDALTGFPISGTARGLEVTLTAIGIITGVAAVLYASVSVDLPTYLGTIDLIPVGTVPLQVVAAGVASALYGAATTVPRRSLPGAGLVGAMGWAIYLYLGHTGTSLILTSGVAAVAVGAVGNIMAGRQRTHPFLYVVPGMMPLVPGLTLYQGMLDMFTSQGGGGAATLLRAVGIGLAIAAGVTLGTMVIRPLRRPLSR